jgi:hypothetical protein
MASAGCSQRALETHDAGSLRDAATDVGLATGRRSFVVTSTFAPPDGGSGIVPLGNGHRFTLVLDSTVGMAFAGANGSGGSGTFQPTATGGRITTTLSFSLGNNVIVNYQLIDVSISAAGALTGTARGQAIYVPPTTDVGSTTTVTASLAGVPDTEAPTFTANVNTAQVDPFSSLSVAASEPLPPTTIVTLADQRGDRIDLTGFGAAAAVLSFAPSTPRMM